MCNNINVVQLYDLTPGNKKSQQNILRVVELEPFFSFPSLSKGNLRKLEKLTSISLEIKSPADALQ